MKMTTSSALTVALAALSINHAVASCDKSNFEECLNGVGPAVTNNDSLRISANNFTQTLRHQSEEANEFETASTQQVLGRAAGDSFTNWSIWFSYDHSNFDANFPLKNALNGLGNAIPSARYDAELDSVLAGADYLLNDQFIFGIALGYENSDIFTAYNGGDNESDGFTISPYAAYLFNDTFSIDVSAGYSDLDYDTKRIDNTNGNTIKGDFDAERWFVASNINAFTVINNWVLGARVGILYTEEKQDAYTETGGPTARSVKTRHIDLTQFVAGVDAAYSFGSYEPYVMVTYLNDLNSENGAEAGGLPGGVEATVTDDDEIQSAVGLRFFTDTVSGSLEYSKVIGRTDFSGHTLLATLRVMM
jgi:outer membrane autotransporter protein